MRAFYRVLSVPLRALISFAYLRGYLYFSSGTRSNEKGIETFLPLQGKFCETFFRHPIRSEKKGLNLKYNFCLSGYYIMTADFGRNDIIVIFFGYPARGEKKDLN